VHAVAVAANKSVLAMVAMVVFPYLRYSLHLLYVEKVVVAAQRKLTYQFHVSFEIHVLRQRHRIYLVLNVCRAGLTA
jgi:hypothetical protein